MAKGIFVIYFTSALLMEIVMLSETMTIERVITQKLIMKYFSMQSYVSRSHNVRVLLKLYGSYMRHPRIGICSNVDQVK